MNADNFETLGQRVQGVTALVQHLPEFDCGDRANFVGNSLIFERFFQRLKKKKQHLY